MKNTIKLFGVIALAVLIGFSMAACDSGDGGNPNEPNSPNNPNNPTTPTGTIWTAVTNGPFNNNILDIAYGNNKFVAVSGMYNNSGGNKLAYSSDGIKWTEIPSNYSYRTGRALVIAYGNNMFVTGGELGETSTSTDGATWTNSTGAGIGEIRAIVCGDGKFVAGSYSGKMAYSSDGIKWTVLTNSPFGNSSVHKIVWGNNKFVAGGSSKIAYSSDGITWTAVTDPFGGAGEYISTIAYGNGKFVAGSSYGKMAYSSDGITWTAVANSPFSYPYDFGDPYFDIIDVVSAGINAIAYGNGKFIALNCSGKTAVSSDGSTWTVVSDSVFGKIMPDLQYGGDLYNNQISSIVYGNGKFVVGGPGKTAYWNGK
jgi:hypothetical protein